MSYHPGAFSPSRRRSQPAGPHPRSRTRYGPGRVIRLRRGAYAAAHAITPDSAAIAVAGAIPRAVVSHRSAALLHGLPLLGTPPGEPEITVPPRSGANTAAVHVHRATLRPEDVVVIDGIAVTSVARTLADVARHRPLGVAVAAMDAALHGGLVSLEEIQDVLAFCRTWPRVPRALRLADGRADSPLESISRLVLPQLGLPAPELQKPIFDQYGRLVATCDFYWDEFGVVGEADGRSKYDARDVLTREKEREELLADLGLIPVRWGWSHVTRRRHVLRARVESGFARGRARDASGFPRLWTL